MTLVALSPVHPGVLAPRPVQEIHPVRSERRACVVCSRAIAPGQLYAVAGPQHIGCRPDAREPACR